MSTQPPRQHASTPLLAIQLHLARHRPAGILGTLPIITYAKMAEITDWVDSFAFMDSCREVAGHFGLEIWSENVGTKTLYYCEEMGELNGA